MEKVKYQDMLPHEIVARRKKFPAAFIGLGGLEWHGEHLAVGNDALKAEKLCELAAAKSGGFAFPTLWYGEPRSVVFQDFNNPEVRPAMGFQEKKFRERYFGKTKKEEVEFYRQLVYHVLVQMNTLEMKAVCFLCGHYPLHDFILPIIERFNKKFKDTQVFAGIEFHYPPGTPKVDFRSLSWEERLKIVEHTGVGGDHAAKWETSYLWYLRPDCVDMSIFRGRENEPLIGVGGRGDPRKEASIEIGRTACNLIVEGMVRKAEQLIKVVDRE